ncbi:nuclear transport factor 2 family protein [Deminuibacter soli]|nr:DUF4878 domain-containing protein [Deminuibacter soli]
MKRLLPLLLVLFSCSAKHAGPKEVTARFFEALAKEQFAEARQYATAESASLLNLMSEAAKQKKDSAAHPPKNDPFEVTNVVITGETATAQVVPSDKTATLTVHLKKENGDWKVAFDKNSILPMIMDAAPKP